MSGPLAHLRVVELAAIGPVPLAGQLMADLGAEVIVIDRLQPAANPARLSEEFAKPDTVVDINRRNKRSISLDLKSSQGREAAQRLINSADVLLEGFRPKVMERLGLGPDSFSQSNPRLVFARMTGWGQDGPFAATAGHDINYLAITGALHAMGSRGAPPFPPLNLVADYGGGSMFLLFGVMAALSERTQSGQGQVVDVAMSEGVTAMMSLFHGLLATGDWSSLREDNMLDGAAPFYRCYETRDGKYLAVGALEPAFFAIMLELAGLPESDNALRLDKRNWPAMVQRYESHFRQKTRDEWAAVFHASDACVEAVLDFDEAREHPQNRARKSWLEIAGTAQAMPAPRFSRTPAALPCAAVEQGKDTRAVLQRCGYSLAELDQLEATGVIGKSD